MIGIAQIAADDWPGRTGPVNGAFFDRDARTGQVGDHRGDIVVDDEAEVGASRS